MKKILSVAALSLALAGQAFLATPALHAQVVSVNGGAISGTITDNTGAVIPNATVTISSPATGYSQTLTTSSTGAYSAGPLTPGNYEVTIQQAGFNQLKVETVVRTGTVTNGNFKLIVGGSSDTIQVTEGDIQLNTEQVSVSSVLTPQQFNTLPVNGRNFLDLAQLEPGVILESGESFDPTKAGYSALSFSGLSGRTTRILLDGQDISDENVGTTIFNVSQGSVQEMQINRSTADPSTDLTSAGSVLVSTRSGTNQFHGQLFYNFQDSRAGFAADMNGIKPPFQRNQFGGSIGGPIFKDKLFFFVNAERNKQDASVASSVTTGSGSFFSAIAAAYPTVPNPTRDTYSAGRLDYNGPHGSHYFFRANYESNGFSTAFGEGYSLYSNRNNAPGFAGGADFPMGHWLHSFRGSYEKFHNFIGDQTVGNAALYNPIPYLHISYATQGLYSGPNDLAPQVTYQSDKQLRYDGSWQKGRHSIRFGANLNRILAGGYASFFALAPRVYISSASLVSGGDASNPLTGYHPRYFYVGNGQGYSTEKPGFGAPAGGQGDWRTAVYIADVWKVTPTFTLTVGARWQRDTGRQDSDLAAIPCSDIEAANFSVVPCTGGGNLLDQFGAGLGGRIQQPNRNIGPQLGFSYNPAAFRKTVLRGGIGVYFENTVFNNVLFDRPARLKSGRFLDYELMCYQGTYQLNVAGQGYVDRNSNGVTIQSMCNMPVSTAAPEILQLQKDFQNGAASVGLNGPNASFVGNTLSLPGGGLTPYAPQYRTPYSTHISFGIQQELWKGTILSADYIHQATVHILQSIDANHVGDSRYLNVNAARAAVEYTNSHTEIGNSGIFCASTDTDCAIQNGVTIADYAANGLDSGSSYLAGAPSTIYGLSPDEGAAFPGINPLVGNGVFNFPSGRAGYDALQVSFRQQINRSHGFISESNLQVSYALSRQIGTSIDANGLGGGDPFFGAAARDYRNPTLYQGPGAIDHRHNVSLGGSFLVKHGPRIGLIGHFRSAAPTTLSLDSGPFQSGQIFITDVTGDGTTSDLVPGTNPGSYMRKYGPKNVNKLINAYNASDAGKLTPAGQAVVAAGVLTANQMASLHGVKPTLVPAPSHAYPNSMFRQVDINASYPIRLKWLGEKASLEPSIAMYNVFNFGNYTGPSGGLQQYDPDPNSSTYGQSLATAGTVSGEYNYDVKNSNRVSRGAGTFAQGAPRITEYQLKFNF